MSKLNVLLLGWEFSSAFRQKQETSCYHIAKSLADRVDLSVLLPRTNPNFILNNLEHTGLDQVDLESIQTSESRQKPLPYSDEPYIKNTVPLYGSVDSINHSKDFVKPEASTKAGEPGSLSQNNFSRTEIKGRAPVNPFGYKDFEDLSLDAQVIEYARYTSRWAAQRKFDLIYAYNYKTFLAGMELKLVTGKKLILQVDSLSYESKNPNSKGWMFELEKQALQKCDYILATTGNTAVTLVKEYGISPIKIESLEEDKGLHPVNFSSLTEKLPVNFNNVVNTISGKEKNEEGSLAQKKEADRWQTKADIIWEVIQMVTTTQDLNRQGNQIA